MKPSTRFKQLVTVGMSAFLLTATSASLVFAQDNSAESSTNNDETTSSQVEETITASELQQAVETAIDLFYDEFPDAEITEIDIDLEANQTYEIQIEGYDGTDEVELEYHTETEEIRELEMKKDDDSNRPLPMEELMTIDEINKIALEEAGFGEITDWHLEYDDDRDKFVWDIEINDTQSDQEAELEIDALSGEILDIELDD